MPKTTTEAPEDPLAKVFALAQMERRPDNTGQCGEPHDWCFDLFAPPMYVAETGDPSVDAALQALRDALVAAWENGSRQVVAAARARLPPPASWTVEFTFHQDGIQLICTRPTVGKAK